MTVGWSHPLFLAAVLSEILLLASLALSIARSEWRVWPPAGRRSAGFWWSWGLTAVAFVGGCAIGLLDYGTAFLDHPAWRVAGIVLIALGTGLADWGVRTLGSRTSSGLGGPLGLRGPYRFSRNPQYVGDATVVVGAVLLADAWRLIPVGVLGVLCLVLAPLAEERWLAERHGVEYDRYRRAVPRFLGRPRRGPQGLNREEADHGR